MIVITTSNSMSVNPKGKRAAPFPPVELVSSIS